MLLLWAVSLLTLRPFTVSLTCHISYLRVFRDRFPMIGPVRPPKVLEFDFTPYIIHM
jgi:hypothetical protein